MRAGNHSKLPQYIFRVLIEIMVQILIVIFAFRHGIYPTHEVGIFSLNFPILIMRNVQRCFSLP